MSLTQDILTAVTGQSFEYSGIFLPPGGYLWENGAAVSRTTYARLFNTITLGVAASTVTGSTTISAVSFNLTTLDHSPVGWPLSGPGIPAGATISSFTSSTIVMSVAATATATSVAVVLAPFGVGDGATTFNVPDSRGRVTAGRDNMGGTAASRMTAAGGVVGTQLGNTAGTETYTLTVAQMPVHAHGFTGTTQTWSTNQGTIDFGSGDASGPTGGRGVSYEGAATVTVTPSGTIGTNGSGNAHPIMQPTIVKHKIIKT